MCLAQGILVREKWEMEFELPTRKFDFYVKNDIVEVIIEDC